MASPQAENGHTDIAHEILEALIKARLTGREWSVVMVILRKTYGWHKKADKISLAQFRSLTGMSRSHCHNTLKSLRQRNIVTVHKVVNSQVLIYGFQKDYDKWRLLPKQVTVHKVVTPRPQGYGQQPLPPRELFTRLLTTSTNETKTPPREETKETLTKETKTNTAVISETLTTSDGDAAKGKKAELQKQAREVFDYYQKRIKPLRRFDTWRPKVEARLKKYSVQDLKTCIDTIATNRWHVENPQHQGFEQIVDSDARVEKWLQKSQVTNKTPEQIRAAEELEFYDYNLLGGKGDAKKESES